MPWLLQGHGENNRHYHLKNHISQIFHIFSDTIFHDFRKFKADTSFHDFRPI